MTDLQPLEKFAESNGNPEWVAKEEWFLYHTEKERFRVVCESARYSEFQHEFAGLWRDEQLAELGIYAPCADAKEFAKKMLDTMFYRLSPHQIQHIANAINKFLEEDHQQRCEYYAKNPDVCGPNPPSRISEDCPD